MGQLYTCPTLATHILRLRVFIILTKRVAYILYYGLAMCRRWSGVAKVSYILRHRGAQLILAYSCARLFPFLPCP